MNAWVKGVGIACLAVFVGACGGGGGGGGKAQTPAASISLDASSVSASATIAEEAPKAHVVVTAVNVPSDGLFVSMTHTSNGIQQVDLWHQSSSQLQADIYFRPPGQTPIGTYNDTVTIRVCFDDRCTRQFKGSPAVVSATYQVMSAQPPVEPGLPILSVLGRTELSHDVIDAEYSRSLDAIVMVSSRPANALRILNPVTGIRHELALNKLPTAVSVSPDGLSAAVGHDALITYVNLSQLVQTGTTTPVLLDVSAQVFDLVLDGRGYVHAFPAVDQRVNLRSIEIATNTETLVSGLIYAGTRGKLHPSGDSIYGANNGLSPSNIEKYDISGGVAQYLYWSPYHGEYEMCGNLWLKEDGQTIYTACGNTFRTSENQAQDMLYSGNLAITGAPYGFRIEHLSQSDATKEIMLIEADWYECRAHGNADKCWTHLAIYESDFLNRLSLYSIPPITIGGYHYMQRGLFVFHSADGARRYMISYLPTTPAAPHYLSVLQ